MKQCVKITLSIENPTEILKKLVHPQAQKLDIEGVGHVQDGLVKITAAGTNSAIDAFIDALYRGYKNTRPRLVEVEPFIKIHDYRGVFRIIAQQNSAGQ